jgi:hypothetical protein
MLEEISHLMLWRNFVYPTYGKHFCILRNGEFFFYILYYGEHFYILRYEDFFFTSYVMENIFTSYAMEKNKLRYGEIL